MKTVDRNVARVSVEEHLANYQTARALLGKGNSERVRERGSSAKMGAKKSAVKNGEKEMSGTAGGLRSRPRRSV